MAFQLSLNLKARKLNNLFDVLIDPKRVAESEVPSEYLYRVSNGVRIRLTKAFQNLSENIETVKTT